MSNIAPHSTKKFDPRRHFLRQDLVFNDESAHLIIKWTKSLQDSNSYHIIQLSSIKNIYLYPVRALRNLLSSRSLPPTAPLFANNFHPFAQIIDRHIRNALKTILTSRNIHLQGHRFHTFRRSGATYAFNHNVPLQNIMAHGLGEVLLFGPTFKTPPWQPQLFHRLLPLPSFLTFSLGLKISHILFLKF